MVGLCFKFWAGILKIDIAISVASNQYNGLVGLYLIQILMWQIEHFLAPTKILRSGVPSYVGPNKSS